MLRTLLILAALAFAWPAAAADYRVGDRLPASKGAKSGFQEITWDDLMPKNWDPMAAFKGIDLSKMSDSDPRAIEALEKARAEWDKAPVEPSMSGRKVRLPGFVIPLERQGDLVSEFLLVPYFGACVQGGQVRFPGSYLGRPDAEELGPDGGVQGHRPEQDERQRPARH